MSTSTSDLPGVLEAKLAALQRIEDEHLQLETHQIFIDGPRHWKVSDFRGFFDGHGRTLVAALAAFDIERIKGEKLMTGHEI